MLEGEKVRRWESEKTRPSSRIAKLTLHSADGLV